MKKKVIAMLLIGAVAATLVACGGSKNTNDSNDNVKIEEKEKEPTDLTGTWVQVDPAETYHKAIISGDVIEIDWISEEDDLEALYWAGTYTAPTDQVEDYKWTSTRDEELTNMALFASTDDTKEFTYSKGKISYSASALETTTTVVLEKISDEAVLNIEPSKSAELIPEGNFEDTGNGTIYVSTPGGTSENGAVPILYIAEDEFYTQISLDATDFDGSKLSYIYLDGKLATKEQLADTQMILELKTSEQLSEGTHKVEVLQFDNDETSGNVITYKTTSFENKLK